MSFFDRRTANILLTVLLFAAGLALLYAARHVIVIFAFAILFAYLINPVVRFLQRHSLFFKDLRGPHIAEAYLVFLLFAGFLVHVASPGLLKGGRFLRDTPDSVDRVATGEIATDIGSRYGWSDEQELRLKQFLAQHRDAIRGFVGAAAIATSTVVGAFVAIPILALFFLSDGEGMTKACIDLVWEPSQREKLRALADEINAMLKNYIRAKVTLGILSLTFYSVAMLALGFPHVLALGFLGGILEFIPVVGWMVSAAIIVAVGGLAHAHWIWMVALLGLWRMTMDYFIGPRVMGKDLQMHPLVVIFAMMVGAAIGGIVGIYLSIPVVAVLRVIWRRCLPAAEAGA